MTKKAILLLILPLLLAASARATTPQYAKNDSIKVVSLLKAARRQGASNIVLYFARQLKGIPYVAKTLEKNDEERLVVNLRQLDCTTYVETVLALTLCHKNGKQTFADYCRYLRLIRYRQGEVAYRKRLHYFTQWIEDNEQMGFVREIQAPNPPFTQWQTLGINYMSTHAQQYPMLAKHPSWVKEIADGERQINGRRYRYIPKSAILNTQLLRNTIHSGDIIAICTNKHGLDTSHISIAVWGKDGLHLLNASQIHKKVVEEPMTLYQYMKRHPTQTGIRVIQVCE